MPITVTNEIVAQKQANKVGIPYYDIKNNTESKGRNHTLSIDRLILNLITISPDLDFNYNLIKQYPEQQGYYIISDSLSLKKSKRLEKNFLHVFDIYLLNDYVGELSTDSRIYNGSELIKLTFKNKVFYTQGWFSHYQSICKELDLKLKNISYLEIAYDGYNLHNRFRDIYLNSVICDRLVYKPVNKLYISSLSNHSEFIIGSGKTGKAIAIYPKTPEIEENNKEYISVFHSLNGLDITQQIDRIELRVKNDYLKKYQIKIEDLTNQSELEAIFKLFTEHSLCFHDLQTKYYDENNNKKYNQISLIDYSEFNRQEFQKVVPKQSTEASTRGIKGAYKHLLFLWIATGKLEYWDALKAFIASPENYLTSICFESYFGTMDILDTNKQLYKDLTHFYIKEYNQPPTPESLERLKTFIDKFYNDYDECEILYPYDANLDLPF